MGGTDFKILAVRIRGGALIISNKQTVGKQKSESKMYKPGHTKRAKRGGIYIHIYICIRIYIYIYMYIVDKSV